DAEENPAGDRCGVQGGGGGRAALAGEGDQEHREHASEKDVDGRGFSAGLRRLVVDAKGDVGRTGGAWVVGGDAEPLVEGEDLAGLPLVEGRPGAAGVQR